MAGGLFSSKPICRDLPHIKPGVSSQQFFFRRIKQLR